MVKVSKDVYFIEASTNVGIINTDNEVYVIDPGTSRKAFKEIKENFEGRKIVVLNTHHHADHILLNYLYQGDFGCSIYANELEVHLINNPDFEGYYLFGSEPPKVFKRTFFRARKSVSIPFPNDIPIKIIELPGHTPGHTGFLYNGVLFTGDLYFDKDILEKYGYPYHFSVSQLKETVKRFKRMDYEIVIPAHGNPSKDPTENIEFMMERIEKIEKDLLDILKAPHSVEEAAFKLAGEYSLKFPQGFFYLFRSFISSLIQDMENELIEEGGKWRRI
ncbi:MAG: MBL fold metallo-hydrolase [Thermotogaceae bacterium]|nr:MBL fold metallo-hydrolase [Thermotogaceae bacterium]